MTGPSRFSWRARGILLKGTVVAVLAALGGLILLSLYWHSPSQGGSQLAPALPAPDPRLSYQGPFKNVRPEVAYVGDAQCALCHADKAETYRRHPMARTLQPIHQLESPPLDGQHRHPFEAFGQRFEVVSRDNRVWHMRTALDEKGDPLFQHELEIHFAIGSGTHAYSFLSIRGTTILQSPITWFTQDQVWDLSPGFRPPMFAGRRVPGGCLYCHSNGANEDPCDERLFREPPFPNGFGIGCERCHGPGGEHVKNPGLVATEQGYLDPTIVNPAHLTPHLRESICWQCHLNGAVRVRRRGRQFDDYRPGLPLEEFLSVFDDERETNFDRLVNHVQQLVRSRCYQESRGARHLGCTSCHDPHEKPAPDQQVAHYRTACLKCHQEIACSLPRPQRLAQNKDDSCVACHMPTFPTSDIVHVSATDHRIPRKPVPRTRPRPAEDQLEEVHNLVSFFERHRVTDDPEVERDRALAGALLPAAGRYLAYSPEQELGAAVQRDPGDLMPKAFYGMELLKRGETRLALQLFKDILARQPDYERGLAGYTVACADLGQMDEAIAAWHRLADLAPTQLPYRVMLASMYAKQNRWEEAAREARTWVAIDPGNLEGRSLLRDLLRRLGQIEEANEQDRIFRELLRRGQTRDSGRIGPGVRP